MAVKDFRRLLLDSLSGIPRGKKRFLPAGFQRIGDIVIVNLDPEVEEFEREIAGIILRNFSYVKTVYKRCGRIEGEFREPRIEYLSGEKRSVTTHRENNCLYKIDVTKIMFYKGNLSERARLPRLVKTGETVVDMFAGIGYFSIPIARLSKPKKVFSIEKNPVAFDLLRENIKLNNVSDRVVPVFGDCRHVNTGSIADRVIMGYLPKTYEFLPYALSSLKNNGGIIHYHDTFHKDELWEKPLDILERYGFKAGYDLRKASYKKIVKDYAPNVVHVVIDAEFKGRN